MLRKCGKVRAVLKTHRHYTAEETAAAVIASAAKQSLFVRRTRKDWIAACAAMTREEDWIAALHRASHCIRRLNGVEAP